jgi:hypothetical protein
MKMVSLMHCRLHPQEIFPVINSVRGWFDPGTTVRPEGQCQRKIQMTPLVIEPETFRLLYQCLNRMHHRVSHVIDFKLMVNRAVIYTFNTLDSRLCRSGWGVVWCNADRSYKCRDNTSIKLIPSPFKSFPSYHSPVTLRVLSTMYRLTQTPTQNQRQCRKSHIVELSAFNSRDMSPKSRQNGQGALRLGSEYTCFLLFFPRIKVSYVKI